MAARRLLERLAVNVLLGFAAGLVAGAAEAWLRARFGAAPDAAAVALGWLLLQAPSRRAAGATLGVLLGFSTFSADPIGALLLGGGVAALLLVPLRDVVYVESALTQVLFGLAAAAALRGARELYVWFGVTEPLPWTAASWTSPLLAGLALPILARVFGGACRMARRLADVIDALRERAGRQPS